MKKIFILFVLLLVLVWCWNTEKENTNEEIQEKIQEKVNEISDNKEKKEEIIDNNEVNINKKIVVNDDVESIDDDDIVLNESKNKFNCEWAYDEIKAEYRTDNILKFWLDYSKCFFEVNDVSCWANSKNSKTINYEVILDYSQSMKSMIWWESRMDIAKNWLETFINNVNKDTNVWLVVYWHKWWSDCKDIEEVVEIWKWNREEIINNMKSYKAKWYTPIWKSLQLAWEKLLQYKWSNYENHILLISDWIESCKWNPIEEVQKLAKENIIVSIVWFDVDSKSSINLKEIADISWWMYYRANNLKELEKHLNDFENNHSCYMDKAMNNFDNSLKVMSDNFACSHALEMEKNWELLDISLLFDAPEECKKELTTKTKIRFFKINKKIVANKKSADDKINKQENENIEIYENNNLDIESNSDLDEYWVDYDIEDDFDF